VLCAMSSRLLHHAGAHVPPMVSAHGQAVALLSPPPATEANLPGRDGAPTAGPLPDAGPPGGFRPEPRALRGRLDAGRRGAQHGLDLEREHFGADHQVLGRHLGVHWGYPPSLVRAIEAHHGDPAPPEGRPCDLADVVHVADTWAWELDRHGLDA